MKKKPVCSDGDAGKLHHINLSDEELDVMIRALTFAADFQDDYYTLYPGDDYNSGNARKQARGERILAGLRANLGDCVQQEATKMKMPQSKQRMHLIVNAPGHLYTPKLACTGKRIALNLSDADWAVANRYRGTFRVKGVIVDLNTGKRYRIKGASCGLSCCCDAIAEEVERES